MNHIAAPLDALSARVRDDLERIAHPKMPWLTPRIGPDGKPALDVLVVGAGQSGIAIGFGLLRAKVTNILAIDRCARGGEGPWLTYARMHTLRSPKDYTGPDLDIPSLTYRAWHEARFVAADWEAMDQIPRQLWAEYLLWVRDVTNVPVRNTTELASITPNRNGLLAAHLRSGDGSAETIHCRKIVLATGQDGMGCWWMPPFIAALPAHLRAHAADAIDFETLRGKVVGVLGAGASALDNAATALEHGAAEVHLFCRRPEPQLVQPYRWLTFAGFLRHLSDLDDEWRWRFMSAILAMREGFPQPTYDRCAKWPNFALRTGETWLGAEARQHRAVVTTSKGHWSADFLICGTGIEMDFTARQELAACATNIATWSDKYQPPDEERNDRLGRFPYLAKDYALVEKVDGITPWIKDIHLFTIASTMSFGPSGSSINAMTTAVPKLVAGLTRSLFSQDIERHWMSFKRYDVPQATVSVSPAS